MKDLSLTVILVFLMLVASCGQDDKAKESDADTTVSPPPETDTGPSRFPYDATFFVSGGSSGNPMAYIPAQCYTRTRDAFGVHNPCFTCHQQGREPNYVNDAALQLSYTFPASALGNPWRNLFKDRSSAVSRISDEAILDYIHTDNYQAADGTLVLADLLRHLPSNWDYDKNGEWDGYFPDAYFRFDKDGFDQAPDGSYTGWRAFAYYPFPGAFMPTNGSTDDVLIRLAEPFRENRQGQFDLPTYKVNLAVVEALIKRCDVAIESVDETRWGVDLNKDGSLGMASRVTYDWAPTAGRTMSYVGLAHKYESSGEYNASAGLFPRGTEFLHSVRYIDVREDGSIGLAPRMKELRYAHKKNTFPYYMLEQLAQQEAREQVLSPDAIRTIAGNPEVGFSSQGWYYQGFIEDRNGNLRPQNREEGIYCMGCHGPIGATTDTVFAFPRKLDGSAIQHGWYHWSQYGLDGVAEPKRADGKWEYSDYLATNGAGDEFRANEEVKQRFFDENGQLRNDAIMQLHDDVSLLLMPSAERALMLDKAYRVIVEEQSYNVGREAHIAPLESVYQQIETQQLTGIDTVMAGPYE